MKFPDKIRLYIGKCDIKDGERQNGTCCPIALALKRKFPKFIRTIYVGGVGNYCPELDYVSIGEKYYTKCKIADSFIRKFDGREAVEPTKIILTKVK